jgi:uncharacterized protein YgbK (DUF1537 family)
MRSIRHREAGWKLAIRDSSTGTSWTENWLMSLIKLSLAVLAEEDAKAKKKQQKAQRLLKKIQEDNYNHLKLDDVVEEGLESFESQEAEGEFYAGSAALEEPLWVTMVENPTDIEATSGSHFSLIRPAPTSTSPIL